MQGEISLLIQKNVVTCPQGQPTDKHTEKMDVENIKAQMRKGILEYCILSTISENEIYASDILDKLKQAKLLVVEGTLYPLLTRLKNDGILDYRWVESTQGPPRKYYKLTPEGSLFLTELSKVWVELVFSVEKSTRKTTGEATA